MADLTNRDERREMVSMIRTVCLVAIVALVLGGLAWNATVGRERLSACEKDFKAAAAVDELQDSHEDLYPAYWSCRSLDEWRAANKRFPAAIDGVAAVAYAGAACGINSETGEPRNPQIVGSPICDAALQTFDPN